MSTTVVSTALAAGLYIWRSLTSRSRSRESDSRVHFPDSGLIAGALGIDEADLGTRWLQSWSHWQRKRPARSPLESRLAW